MYEKRRKPKPKDTDRENGMEERLKLSSDKFHLAFGRTLASEMNLG